MRAGIHAAVQKQVFMPLFCTSAENNIGVARLMDFIAKYGSSPVDRKKVKAHDADGNEVEVSLTDPDPVCYIFKTMSEAQFGELSFFRVYSGSVKFGSGTLQHRPAQHGKDRPDLSAQRQNARNRALAQRRRHRRGGETEGHAHRQHALRREETRVAAESRISQSRTFTPRSRATSKGEEDKIASGLAALHHEDPTFLHHVDGELHQTILSAQGELHLEVIADRLRRRYNVHVELTEPRVRYRETIKGKGESKYRHKKQTGGAGQFAEVWMRIEPKPRDTGVEFTQSLVGPERGPLVSCRRSRKAWPRRARKASSPATASWT